MPACYMAADEIRWICVCASGGCSRCSCVCVCACVCAVPRVSCILEAGRTVMAMTLASSQNVTVIQKEGSNVGLICSLMDVRV